MNIIILKDIKRDRYQCYLAGHPTKFGGGKTEVEAVGEFFLRHAGILKITIERQWTKD